MLFLTTRPPLVYSYWFLTYLGLVLRDSEDSEDPEDIGEIEGY